MHRSPRRGRVVARRRQPAVQQGATTCATLLLLADVPAKVVSERLGHSSITLPLDTYSHVLLTMQRRAADLMGEILGRRPAEGGKPLNGGSRAVQG